MATRAPETASFRKVVLLRPSENRRLQKLAREKKVSTSEIIRRSLEAYASAEQQEQEDLQGVIAQMNEALDRALLSVRSARAEVADNLEQIRRRREQTA